MGEKTPNFSWDYGNEFDDNWWNTWAQIFVAIDTTVHNIKAGVSFNGDITLPPGNRFIVVSPDGTKKLAYGVDNNGQPTMEIL